MTDRPDLTVVVPSRGRPQAAAELAQAFADTCTANTRLVFALDEDDEYLDAYANTGAIEFNISTAPSTMVKALNEVAVRFAGVTYAIGFMGDDHRPRTKGWDARYVDELFAMGTGIVYGNDLLQGRRIPTQVAMTSNIVQTLGYMAPPAFTHLFVDNYWKQLGHGAHCLRYLPDVIIEHMHPAAGKAFWDEGHRRVNTPDMYLRDSTVMSTIDLTDDIAKVCAL